MWTEVDASSLPQLAVGALVGAVAAAAFLRTRRTTFVLLAVNVAVGMVGGAAAVIGMWWPQAPLMLAVGFVGAAAPITLALPLVPYPATAGAEAEAEARNDVRTHLRRSVASFTVHVVYGVVAGTAGFGCAYGLAIAVYGALI